MSPRVKICGLTGPDDAAAAVAAGADLVGFIFVPGTRRALDPDAAGWVGDVMGAERVGVFRGSSLAEILRVRERLALDWVQLHGDEPDDWLAELGPRVIRRVATAGGPVWPRVAALAACCLPLLDPGAGDGVAPEWAALGEPPADLAFGVAGGLTPASVGDVVRLLCPALVDVASGVEAAPGRKDPELMRAFVAAARAAAGPPVSLR